MSLSKLLSAISGAFKRKNENSIYVIHPYIHWGIWVFDDEAKGLKAEAFVGGMSEIIDEWVIRKGRDNPFNEPELGLTLAFSKDEFPEYDFRLQHLRKEGSGNRYIFVPEDLSPTMEGWLCAQLGKYFSEPPKNIFVKVL